MGQTPEPIASTNAGGLQTNTRGKLRLLHVLPSSEHYFRAVEADCLHFNSNFALFGLGLRHVFDLEDLGATQLMNAPISIHFSGCRRGTEGYDGVYRCPAKISVRAITGPQSGP